MNVPYNIHNVRSHPKVNTRLPRNLWLSNRMNKKYDGERWLTQREISGVQKIIREYMKKSFKNVTLKDALNDLKYDEEGLLNFCLEAISEALSVNIYFDDEDDSIQYQLEKEFLPYAENYYWILANQKFGEGWEKQSMKAHNVKPRCKPVKKCMCKQLSQNFRKML